MLVSPLYEFRLHCRAIADNHEQPPVRAQRLDKARVKRLDRAGDCDCVEFATRQFLGGVHLPEFDIVDARVREFAFG